MNTATGQNAGLPQVNKKKKSLFTRSRSEFIGSDQCFFFFQILAKLGFQLSMCLSCSLTISFFALAQDLLSKIYWYLWYLFAHLHVELLSYWEECVSECVARWLLYCFPPKLSLMSMVIEVFVLLSEIAVVMVAYPGNRTHIKWQFVCFHGETICNADV